MSPILFLGKIGKLNAVVREHRVNAIASTKAFRKVTAAWVSARGTNWAKVNLEVRSIVTKRYSLPSAVETSAISR